MVIRQHAIHTEDKRNATTRSSTRPARAAQSPERVTTLPKSPTTRTREGTVISVPSKEELLLAVHERRIDGFFRDVIALVEGEAPVSIDAMLALTHRHLVVPPLFLPLASRCFGLMAHNLPGETAKAFKQRMAARLERAGAGLERHFPTLPAGGGVALLRRSYALILGLWQMSPSAEGDAAHCAVAGPGASPVFAWSYPTELDVALRALWQGMIGATPEIAR
jgi:AcrR family transcriptional regulator